MFPNLTKLVVFLLASAPLCAAATPPLYIPWPCDKSYRVTQSHNGGSHTGDGAWAWDFGLPVGAEVTAPAAGVVRRIRMDSTQHGCDRAYATKANYVVIDFGDGTEALLAHLQANSSNLRVGDRVEAGQVVGKVGLSGYICGAHLHFQLQKPCSSYSCWSIRGSFVDYGDPARGTTIRSNNCGQNDEVVLQANTWDRTMSDIDGDGLADVCARAAAGIRCALSSGAAIDAPFAGPELDDDSGWSDVANFSTLRMADITGDGRADLCARANKGIRCWVWDGTALGDPIVGPELADDASWDEPQHYSTIRMPDIDGDGAADLCARGAEGIRCYRSTGAGFGPSIEGPALSDDAGWDRPEYYATLRFADVNGDGTDDLCARGPSGYSCWPSTGDGFGAEIAGPAWRDDNGWSKPQYYTTIRTAELNGDGRADLCARAAAGIRCYLSTGDGFEPAIEGPTLSDDTGWADPANYGTLMFGDVDGDGRDDLCARANARVVCWKSDGDAFGPRLEGPELSDDLGWDDDSVRRTLRLADVDGDGLADLCGRGPDGFQCWASDGDGFGSPIVGLPWSDENGWARPEYASTLRMGAPALCSMLTCPTPPQPETETTNTGSPQHSASEAGNLPEAEREDADFSQRPLVIEATSGCACASSTAASGDLTQLALLLGLLGARRRRSRKRQSSAEAPMPAIHSSAGS